MEYVNLNKCRSFNLQINYGELNALTDQVCSETIIVNRTGEDIEIYDGGYTSNDNSFLLANLESATFRGVTNSNQISAVPVAGGEGPAGYIYYRTQYFSNSPSR